MYNPSPFPVEPSESMLERNMADLSKSLGIGAHVGEDDEDMLLTLIGQVLC